MSLIGALLGQNEPTALEKKITTVQSVAWDFIARFDVQIAGENWELPDEFISASILNVVTPDIVSTPVEDYYNGRWYYTTGRNELYTFSMTFRDFNKNFLHRAFNKFYITNKNKYPKDQYLYITLYKPSHKDHDASKDGKHLVYEMKDCIISSISNVTYDQSAVDTISEFTVTFKTHQFLSDDQLGGNDESLARLFGSNF